MSSTAKLGGPHDVRLAIITWIETTYHRRRRQHSLGMLTPIEFETLHQTAHGLIAPTRPSQQDSGQTGLVWRR
jgi:hypothetical protein